MCRAGSLIGCRDKHVTVFVGVSTNTIGMFLCSLLAVCVKLLALILTRATRDDDNKCFLLSLLVHHKSRTMIINDFYFLFLYMISAFLRSYSNRAPICERISTTVLFILFYWDAVYAKPVSTGVAVEVPHMPP